MYNIMNREELTNIGFQALTYPYTLPFEEEEFARALHQVKKGSDPWAILDLSDNEKEIWTIPNSTPIPEDE